MKLPWHHLLAVVLALPLWLTGGTAGAEMEDLYQAAVPVQGRGADERNAAVQKALGQILVRVTGERDVAGRDGAAAVLHDASSLVQQYRYDNLPAAADGTPGGLQLLVRFDPNAVEQTLRAHQLPVWGANRPGVLLWLGVEQGGQRRFYQPDTDPDLAAVVDRVARERGIDFLFPLLDLEDMSHVQAQDLWGGFESRLREASARYQADLILVGRLQAVAGGWRADWQLLHADSAESWGDRGTREEAVGQGLEQAVDRIAARYAPLGGNGDVQGSLVRVLGVNDLGSFLRADAFFRAMDGVVQVALVRTDSDHALFRIGIRGGSDALSRAATLGGVFQAEPAPVPTAPGAKGMDLLPDLILRLRD